MLQKFAVHAATTRQLLAKKPGAAFGAGMASWRCRSSTGGWEHDLRSEQRNPPFTYDKEGELRFLHLA